MNFTQSYYKRIFWREELDNDKKEYVTNRDWANLFATVFGLVLIIIPIEEIYVRILAFIILILVLYSSGMLTRFKLIYRRLASIKYDIISISYANRFSSLSTTFEKIVGDDVIQEIFKQAKKDYEKEVGWRYDTFINGNRYEKWEGIKKWKGVRKFNHGSLLKNAFKFEDFIIRGHTAYIDNIIRNKDNKISEDIKNRYNNYFRISYLHFIDLYMMLLFEIEHKFKNSYHFKNYYNSILYKDLQIEQIDQE